MVLEFVCRHELRLLVERKRVGRVAALLKWVRAERYRAEFSLYLHDDLPCLEDFFCDIAIVFEVVPALGFAHVAKQTGAEVHVALSWACELTVVGEMHMPKFGELTDRLPDDAAVLARGVQRLMYKVESLVYGKALASTHAVGDVGRLALSGKYRISRRFVYEFERLALSQRTVQRLEECSSRIQRRLALVGDAGCVKVTLGTGTP